MPEKTPKSITIDPSRWVEDYGDYLLRFAQSRVGNPTAAEDLVQETFLAALKARDKFSGKSSVKTWLTGILKYKVIDHYRKDSRTDTFSELTSFYGREAEEMFGPNHHWRSDNISPPRDWQPEQLANIDRKEFMEQFRLCCDKLPEKIRQVFILREIDDLKTDEICTLLSISRQNLWTILHRARMALRRCLEKVWFADQPI